MNKKPKILVVGSFVMDQIASTSVFPREGQTVLGNSFHKAPGGKGANQAVQAARLGADVAMFGKLGRDANGEELIGACRDSGVNTDMAVFDGDSPSGCAVIILEEMNGGGTKNRIIVLPGSNMRIRPADVAFLKEKIGGYDLVMLQLEIPMEINERIAEYAFAKGVPVMLNSAPSAPLSDTLLSRLTFISPNEHEARDMTGIEIPHDGGRPDMDKAKAAAAALRKKGVKNVLITLGSAGAVLDTGDKFYYSPCVDGVRVVDPTAAGDSFVGAFCVGVCGGLTCDEALLLANHTASLTVSRMGAMPSLPKLAEVEEFMLRQSGVRLNLAALKG